MLLQESLLLRKRFLAVSKNNKYIDNKDDCRDDFNQDDDDINNKRNNY